MNIRELEILKGIHPGFVLDKELRERHLAKGRFALSINEFPQTIGAITKGKRGMNTALALRIEKALGLEEGFFMILQVYYDIKQEKERLLPHTRPDLSKFRRMLFWDTDIEKIDWQRQKVAIIKRVLERGNDVEKKEIANYYGEAAIRTFNKNTTVKYE